MSRVELTIDGTLATLRLANPTKLNALTVAMLDELANHCRSLEKNREVRAVILSSSGKKAFCAGADINAWSQMDAVQFAREWVMAGHRLFEQFANLPMPTIAAINGLVCGGGLELAVCCDLRIIASSAKLALPETGIGVVPGWSGTQRLKSMLPNALINEMVLLGNQITAERAYQVGFVNAVDEQPQQLAKQWAIAIARNSPLAVETAKRMIKAGGGSVAAIEALGSMVVTDGEQLKEGISAFKQKRQPDYS